MAKDMLINVSTGEECRIALLENNKLEELYMERTSATSHVGNIYKGKVTNVEPSIQAAFVDFGIGRNGFLHISDLMPSYFGKKAGNVTEPVGRKLSRRDRPPIQQCLRKGDEIVVQIIKEGIGTKGPTLSTYLSVPGRVLVMMPGMSKMGVSKKIEDEEERLRLRKILDGLKPPKDCGFIIRTAGIGKSKLEIERDLKYLARLWETLKKKIDNDKPPVELYTEGDLVTRTVRDVFTSDVDQIIVDDKETARKIKDFIKLAMPRTKNKVVEYKEQVPLFHKYEIEDVIEGMYSRRVSLPSGGSLIIDQTEAVVAIDVNSGKFRDHSDAETTAFKTDMEAADEIPRQLRLRDMGGVIICDFIDLRFDRHRREVEQRLFDNMKNDRAKTRMLRMSQFGIIEMTRQRMRPSLKKSIYQECKSCAGQGMVKTPESMALDVMRKMRIGLDDTAVMRVQLAVHPEVAIYLLNKKRAELAELEEKTEKKILVAPDAALAMDEVKFELYDGRDGYIYIAELGMALPAVHHQQRQIGGPPAQAREGRGRGRDREGQRSKPKHDRRDEEALDTDDLFSEEEAEPREAKSKALPPAREHVEETGNDDEASVVDVDDAGDAMPGQAPDGFFDSNDQRPNDRNRRDNRRGGRGGRDQIRGQRDRRPPNDNRPNDNRSNDNRNNAQRNGAPQLPVPASPVTRVEVEGEEVFDEIHDDAETPRSDAPAARDNSGGQQQRQNQDNRGENEDGSRRRRRRRGGRGRRGRGGKDGADNGPNNGGPTNDGPNNGGANNVGPRNGPNNRSQQRPAIDGLPSDEELDAEGAALEAAHGLKPTVRDTPREERPVANDVRAENQFRSRDDNGSRGGRGGRNRGGRGRGRGGKNQPPRREVIEGLPNDEELDAEAAALEARLAKARVASDGAGPTSIESAPKPIHQSPVVKTGSSDKHLADDEPVAHEPVRRPSSYSDLDELPDFDEDA